MKAVFLDRDGTVIIDRGYLADPAGVELVPGVADALRRLHAAGYRLFFITNQSGIGRGLMTREQSDAVHRRTLELLAAEGIPIAGSYICPHAPWDHCQCRKPSPVLMQQAAAEHAIDFTQSFMIGDKQTDVDVGKAVGCRTALYPIDGDWKAIVEWALA